MPPHKGSRTWKSKPRTIITSNKDSCRWFHPTHLPSSHPRIDQVEVWLKLPAHGKIEATIGPNGEPLLDFPVGTIADRVEYVGVDSERRIADIRGAEILPASKQRFHVYRPKGTSATDPLFGVQWTKGDQAAHRKATERLIDKLRGLPPATKMPNEQRRAAFFDDIRRKNQCLPCHEPKRPNNSVSNEYGLVNRGTDGSGFFTPTTLMRDEIPLESYGRHDLSYLDPGVEVRCPSGDKLENRTCASGAVPVGRWHPQQNRERLRRVCEARRYLWDHMSKKAKAHFPDSMTVCSRDVAESSVIQSATLAN